MKYFWVIAILLICLLPAAHAQQEADERYVTIYNLIQQGDSQVDSGQPRDALQTYIDAQARLERFQRVFPAWDPGIVTYRLNDLQKKILALNGQIVPQTAVPSSSPLATVAVPTTTADNTAAQLQSQLGNLQQQLQTAQTENQTLQAKLKEALATQPADVDAGELAAAQAQNRSLMKENALLQVAPSPKAAAPVPDSKKVSQLRQQLVDAVQKLKDEHKRAETLVEENASLQRNIARSGMDSESLDLLRSENGRLKAQLASLQAAANDEAAAGEMSTKLKQAQTQIEALQSATALSALEKAALENKVRKLSSELSESAANFDGQVRDLKDQRDDLMKQLAAAQGKNSQSQTADVSAQIGELNNEVNVLKSRVAVDESKPIPYTADELALFKQPEPTVQPVQRSVHELPAGTADLVVSAQRHFSNHEFDAAEADYLKILERDENNGIALANLATIEMQENKFEDAEKHIKAALVQSPEDAYNLSTLGYLYFRLAKYDEALDALSHAVKIDPGNPETQNYLGVTLSHKGLRMQAETTLRKALQLDPNYAPAHNNIALIYLTQSPPLPQLARWHYQKALDAGQARNPELEKMLADKGAPVAQPAAAQ